MQLTRHNRKRVVVTGLGVVSPLGAKTDFWDAITRGESGVKRLQTVETAHLNVKIGAEIRDFDSSEYIPPKAARRMGRASQFAIVAACQAVEDAGFSIDEISDIGHQVATIIGTTLGSYEVGEAGIRSWREERSQARQPHEHHQCLAKYAIALCQPLDERCGTAGDAVGGMRHRHSGNWHGSGSDPVWAQRCRNRRRFRRSYV